MKEKRSLTGPIMIMLGLIVFIALMFFAIRFDFWPFAMLGLIICPMAISYGFELDFDDEFEDEDDEKQDKGNRRENYAYTVGYKCNSDCGLLPLD